MSCCFWTKNLHAATKSSVAQEPALVRSYGLHKQIEAVKGTRSVQKKERAGSLGGQNAPMEVSSGSQTAEEFGGELVGFVSE